MSAEGLAAVAALWLLGKKARAPEQPATAAKPVEEPKNPLGVLGSAADALISGAGAGATGAGGLTGAGAGSGAGAGTTGAGGLTGAGAGSGAGGGAGTGVGGSIAIGAGVGSILGAVVASAWVLSYVVLLVVGKLVNTAMEFSKGFEHRVYFNNPNARALCTFESIYAKARLEAAGRTYAEADVRDWRLDQTYSSNGATSQGYRTVLSYLPKAEEQVEVNGLRSDLLAANARFLAQEFLDYRARVGASQIRHWLRRPYSEEWGWREFVRTRLYEAVQPGLGGLDGLPLVTGKTERSRSDYSEASPPVEELRAAPGIVMSSAQGLAVEEIRLARALGVVDALQACRWDPTVYVGLTPEQYAADTWQRCQLDQFRGITRNGACFEFAAQEWGVAFQFWPHNAKERNHAAVQLLPQPAPLPKPALSPSAQAQIAMGF